MPPQYGVFSKWSEFENVVAQIYRILGTDVVKQNVSLGGHQIDIYIEETTTSGQKVRTAVECKYYQKNVGKDVVSHFGLISDFLKKSGLIDKSVLLAYVGFTKEASLAAKAIDVELVTIAALEARLASKSVKGMAAVDELIKKTIKDTKDKPLPDRFDGEVFVLMPFSDELNDLYIYGIRGCVEKLALTAVRADEIEHNEDILQEIIDHIKRAQFVVAEVSDKNPNVFYEVGWAHALERQTVLIARKGTEIPFDLRGKNHLIYNSINHLENLLTKRLKSLLDD